MGRPDSYFSILDLPQVAPGGVATTLTLAPMLSVRDAPSAIEFFKAAFGATEVFAWTTRPWPS
jgi:hypothetical protein